MMLGSIHGFTGRALAASAAALFLASPSLAGNDDRDASADEVALVEAALARHGYSDVHDVEIDDGRFEADALSPEGEPVEIELDLETLEVVEVEPD